MNILDYLWFLIRFVGLATILLFICGLFISIFASFIEQGKERIRKRMLDQALEEALRKGNFQVGVLEDKEKDNEK